MKRQREKIKLETAIVQLLRALLTLIKELFN